MPIKYSADSHRVNMPDTRTHPVTGRRNFTPCCSGLSPLEFWAHSIEHHASGDICRCSRPTHSWFCISIATCRLVFLSASMAKNSWPVSSWPGLFRGLCAHKSPGSMSIKCCNSSLQHGCLSSGFAYRRAVCSAGQQTRSEGGTLHWFGRAPSLRSTSQHRYAPNLQASCRSEDPPTSESVCKLAYDVRPYKNVYSAFVSSCFNVDHMSTPFCSSAHSSVAQDCHRQASSHSGIRCPIMTAVNASWVECVGRTIAVG